VGTFSIKAKRKLIAVSLLGVGVLLGIANHSYTTVSVSSSNEPVQFLSAQSCVIQVTQPGCITQTTVPYNCGHFDITPSNPRTIEEDAAISADWEPKEAIPLPPGAIELRENGIVTLRRGKKTYV